MYTDEIRYEILKNFLEIAQMSNRAFAKRCGIKPTTFQAMLDRKSGIKPETLIAIKNAMKDLLQESPRGETREKLRILYECFKLPSSYNKRIRNIKDKNLNYIHNIVMSFLSASEISLSEFASMLGISASELVTILSSDMCKYRETVILILKQMYLITKTRTRNFCHFDKKGFELNCLWEDAYVFVDEIMYLYGSGSIEGENIVPQEDRDIDYEFAITEMNYELALAERKRSLNAAFDVLNEQGQEKLIEHAEMLTKIPEYREDGD